MSSLNSPKNAICSSLTTLLLLFACVSCDQNLMFSDSQRVNESGWDYDDHIAFDVDVQDSTILYDFLVEVRNRTDYAYSNLFLFITTTFPDGSVAADTLECPLAAPDGRWYGKNSGHYIDSRFFLRQRVRFPFKGVYHFDCTHGMRDSSLVGIRNVGLRIEKSSTTKQQ